MRALESIVADVKHFLRGVKKESVYRTAQESGLRQEVIKRLESGQLKGTAESLDTYLSSFAARYPEMAYRAFYQACCRAANNEFSE